MVHIRFVGLGVPESAWGDLLEEAARVLRIGGVLEIVEMSYNLSDNTPLSLRNSFASLLLSDMIQPSPLLPLQFTLPSTPNLSAGIRPDFEKEWLTSPPGALRDAVFVWVSSALDYKGTGLQRGKGSVREMAPRAKRELHEVDRIKWKMAEGDEMEVEVQAIKANVWAWVCKKV